AGAAFAAFRAAIRRLGEPDRFRVESRRAAAAAERFSYGRYLDDVRTLFRDRFGIRLPGQAGV
ncbi:MAG: hypothetical protein AAGF23_12390, partial [Acidobacteriota bacterium]